MLLIKITDDLDVFDSMVTRIDIRPEYEKNQSSDHYKLLKEMGFVWNKSSKFFTKLVMNKEEVKKLIKVLTIGYKEYVLEHVKVMKRKRSNSLLKAINVLKSKRVNGNLF